MEASKHAKNRVAITVVFALTLTSASAGKLFRFVVIFADKRCRQNPSRSVPLLSLKLFSAYERFQDLLCTVGDV